MTEAEMSNAELGDWLDQSNICGDWGGPHEELSEAARRLRLFDDLVTAAKLAEQQLINAGSDGYGSGLTAALAALEPQDQP